MILNADDLGYSAEVNSAIVEACERKLVMSTSLMANQPGFEEACELVRRSGLRAAVGVHLVLTEGEPLTEPMRRCPRFCDEGGSFFAWRASGRAFRLSRAEVEAVAQELGAQVKRCRAAGVEVAHVDSHHHVHNEWAIGRVVVALAQELRIPRVRLARNCGPGIGVVSAGYKHLYNMRLRRAGLAGTRFFGNVEDWLHLRASGAGAAALEDFELMVHPVHGEVGALVDLEAADRPLEGLLAPVLSR